MEFFWNAHTLKAKVKVDSGYNGTKVLKVPRDILEHVETAVERIPLLEI